MVSRTLLIVSVLGMVGICAAVVRPVVMYARMHRAERAWKIATFTEREDEPRDGDERT